MAKNKSNKKGSGRGTPKRRGDRQIIGGASKLSSFRVRKTFRFVADADVDADLSTDYFRNLIGTAFHSVSINGFYRWIDTFRLLQIRAFYVNPASATPKSIDLEWTSTAYTESNRISSTSLGVQPARLASSPPAHSQASWWLGTNNITIMHIKVPQNAVVEIDMDVILADDVTAYQNVFSTVADARIYVKPLDAVLNSSAGHLQPQGFPNVIQY